MKTVAIIALLLSTSLIGCSNNPYRVCNDPANISDRDTCIQEVQEELNQRHRMWGAISQSMQSQPTQSNYNYQMPVRQSVQTNCVRNGAYTNCSSY